MDISRISKLIVQEGFELQCWNDRYSKGVWAVCLPGMVQGEAVRDASEDGDVNMYLATNYLLECNWLPVVVGETLLQALTALEQRLGELEPSELTRASNWTKACTHALEHFIDVRRASAEHGGEPGTFRALPADFRTLLESVEAEWEAGREASW